MDPQLATIMQNAEIRKAFGGRLKALRKQKGWTQKDLANRIGTSFQQLNKYEGGTNAPPLDKLLALAEALETTVDYLIAGTIEENRPLHNTRLLERFQELEAFSSDDQETVIKLIDAMIVKRKVEGVVRPMGG